MKIKLLCLEDGIISYCFRKILSYVKQFNRDTHCYYVSTNLNRSMLGRMFSSYGGSATHDDYKKIRYPSSRYIIEEVKHARKTHPFISSVSFHDDSFMALCMDKLQEFAILWRAEVNLPFAVYGVIPNYAREEKFEVLTWAGMNRMRMGIQSGSKAILDFYKRPTSLENIEKAASIANKFKKYHIPPTYDIIVDNPLETREDNLDTLEWLYRLPRPYFLLIFSLKIIPNTELERLFKEQGIDHETIDKYYSVLTPTFANMLVYMLTFWKRRVACSIGCSNAHIQSGQNNPSMRFLFFHTLRLSCQQSVDAS